MQPDLSKKLAILADAAKYDASCASSGATTQRKGATLGTTTGMGICHSYAPDGRCISLLKLLLTNYCIYDCQYCVNRITSNTPRARFSVDEVVYLTIEFYKRNYIEGLFLSSGIIQTPDYTMEQLVDVARKLRLDQHFGGYIHLKTIPNASQALIDEAGLYADRLSVNIELPTVVDLQALAPEKKRPEIESAMQHIRLKVDETKADKAAGMKPPIFVPGGQSTQMIIGATPSTDADIMQTANSLYTTHKLKRVYYSAYSPIPHADARLPGLTPPLMREHRLYQTDWLLRHYGFKIEEILNAEHPNLDLSIDPKTAWALQNRGLFPVDVNKASREQLLRVPGLGVRSVERILRIRRYHSIVTDDMKRMKMPWARVAPFVITSDWNGELKNLDRLDLKKKIQDAPRQLSLFEPHITALTGEI